MSARPQAIAEIDETTRRDEEEREVPETCKMTFNNEEKHPNRQYEVVTRRPRYEQGDSAAAAAAGWRAGGERGEKKEREGVGVERRRAAPDRERVGEGNEG